MQQELEATIGTEWGAKDQAHEPQNYTKAVAHIPHECRSAT
jgi:hypothetical protein